MTSRPFSSAYQGTILPQPKPRYCSSDHSNKHPQGHHKSYLSLFPVLNLPGQLQSANRRNVTCSDLVCFFFVWRVLFVICWNTRITDLCLWYFVFQISIFIFCSPIKTLLERLACIYVFSNFQLLTSVLCSFVIRYQFGTIYSIFDISIKINYIFIHI